MQVCMVGILVRDDGRDRALKVLVSGLLARGQWRTIGAAFGRPRSRSVRAMLAPMSMTPTLILASASPRRRQLLAEAGYGSRSTRRTSTSPSPARRPSPAEYVAQLAWRKAMAVAGGGGRA